MAMTEPGKDEHGGLAAEYVLGTLDAAEKAEADDLMRSSAAFAAEVENWRRRFDPLLSSRPAPPPEGALDKIFAAIDVDARRPDAEVLQLRRNVAIWKWRTGAAAALAASLIGFIAIRSQMPPSLPAFVAVLEPPGGRAAFFATANPSQGGLTVRRLGPPPPPGRSYELWAIREGAAPQSLGVVDRAAGISGKTLLQKTGGEPLGKILLAITEEPQGGSPGGKPSGAPIYTGKFIQTPAS